MSNVLLSPCHGYSLGVFYYSSVYFHYVKGTHCERLVNRLFVSMVSWVLIGGVLSNIYLSPLCQGYSLGVYCQSSICLHDVSGTDYGCIVNLQGVGGPYISDNKALITFFSHQLILQKSNGLF